MEVASLLSKVIILMASSVGISSPTTVEETTSILERSFFVAHLQMVADVPPEYGRYVYDAAIEEGIDPTDLAAILISEKSGPDKDFSLEGAHKRPYDFEYTPHAEGAAGEKGLFQVMPRWARKAGYTEEDLHDPEKSAKIAAYVVKTNQESHKDCEKRAYNFHTWVAHYKCARVDRDVIDPENFCRFKQMKFEQLRISLDSVESPDFKSIREKHQKRLRKVQKRAEKDWMRRQRRAARQAKERAEKAKEEQASLKKGDVL